MLRKALCALALLWTGAAQALQVGDVLFSAFNGDEDGWSVVALAGLPSGTVMYFSENSWNGISGEFESGEAYYTWTLGEDLPAGRVVRFSAVNRSGRTASVGSLSATAGAELSATAESLFAYTGDSAQQPARFVAALSTEGFADDQLAGTGLIKGLSAVVLTGSTDFAEYIGPRSGKARFTDYAKLLADPLNWNILVGGNQASRLPVTDSFAIRASVPEPASGAMVLAGLGLLGAIRRSRRPAGSGT